MKKIVLILLTIIGFYSCHETGENKTSNEYYFDIYVPDNLENTSGKTTEKLPVNYNGFEKEFKKIDWKSYLANPTLSVYNKSTILWVALYATSEDADKLQMFIVGHHYKKDTNDFSTTHMMVGSDKFLPLFKHYFENNNTDEIITELKKLDEQFKQETGQ